MKNRPAGYTRILVSTMMNAVFNTYLNKIPILLKIILVLISVQMLVAFPHYIPALMNIQVVASLALFIAVLVLAVVFTARLFRNKKSTERYTRSPAIRFLLLGVGFVGIILPSFVICVRGIFREAGVFEERKHCATLEINEKNTTLYLYQKSGGLDLFGFGGGYSMMEIWEKISYTPFRRRSKLKPRPDNRLCYGKAGPYEIYAGQVVEKDKNRKNRDVIKGWFFFTAIDSSGILSFSHTEWNVERGFIPSSGYKEPHRIKQLSFSEDSASITYSGGKEASAQEPFFQEEDKLQIGSRIFLVKRLPGNTYMLLERNKRHPEYQYCLDVYVLTRENTKQSPGKGE